MKRESHEVRAVRHGNGVELYVDDFFVTGWRLPQDTPDGMVPIETVSAMLEKAYRKGYAAARRDLKDWVDGKY